MLSSLCCRPWLRAWGEPRLWWTKKKMPEISPNSEYENPVIQFWWHWGRWHHLSNHAGRILCWYMNLAFKLQFHRHCLRLKILSVCVCVCLPVCLSRFYGLCLGYYRSDFEQPWWKCLNLEPIDCTTISEKSIQRWSHYPPPPYMGRCIDFSLCVCVYVCVSVYPRIDLCCLLTYGAETCYDLIFWFYFYCFAKNEGF